MFKRLRQAAVESFVGAVALGYLLAQAVLHFVNAIASPVQVWVSQNELHRLMPGSTGAASAGLSLKDGAPELIRFLLLAVVWYSLMRWLYFGSLKRELSGSAPNPAVGE